MIQLVVSGEPVAASRPRVAVRNGKPHGYTAGPYRTWKDDAVKQIAAQWRHRTPLDGPLSVSIHAWFFTRDSKRAGMRKTTKPDIDNIAKGALDALVDAGVIAGDQLVTELYCRKHWTGQLHSPSTVIMIYEIEPA